MAGQTCNWILSNVCFVPCSQDNQSAQVAEVFKWKKDLTKKLLPGLAALSQSELHDKLDVTKRAVKCGDLATMLQATGVKTDVTENSGVHVLTKAFEDNMELMRQHPLAGESLWQLSSAAVEIVSSQQVL